MCYFIALRAANPFMFPLAWGEGNDRNASSEEELDVNNKFIDPQAEDQELKGQLLRRYGGYLGCLKRDFMKKKRKGNLLKKRGNSCLIGGAGINYNWPYPSACTSCILKPH
jgi:hypothetical protein